jgi:hypothetical protein
MRSPSIPPRMPDLPHPGQKVCWRDPPHARALGWAHILGSGPFEVVRVVDKSDQGLAAALILRTEIGEREISEVWLARVSDSDMAPNAQDGARSPQGKPTGCGS